MSKATDRQFEVFGSEFQDLLSVALSNSLKRVITTLDKEIQAEVKRSFFFPGDSSKLSKIEFTGKGKKIQSASLIYKYKRVSLSSYPMKQVRVTTGGRKLLVSRGQSGRGKGFTKTITKPETAVVTMFKLRRSDPWRVVQGRIGYRFGGFLHTGRKKGSSGFNGQTNTFTPKVFERSQKQTWNGSQRAPIHALWGASFVALMQSREVQDLLRTTGMFNKIETELEKSLSRRI